MTNLDPSTQDQADRWLRPREAEDIFGYSEKHLRRLAQRGEIAARRTGMREVLLSEKSLRDYKARMERAGTAKYSPYRPLDMSNVSDMSDASSSPCAVNAEADADELMYQSVTGTVQYEAVHSQYFLTDCPDVLLSAPEKPYVSVTRDLSRTEVERLCQSRRVQHFFSDMPAAEFVTQRLGIKRVDNARPPTLSHGDNVIIAQVSQAANRAQHDLRFTLVQITL